MPKIKNTLLPQNLASYDVYIEDTSEQSDYFRVTNLPSVLTGGRNSFLLGGSNYLQDGSQIKIEITDSAGNPIYQTTVAGYNEGNSKMVSVEIYNDTAPGFATIVVMGKAFVDKNGNPIPSEWVDSYNVRWSKKILVDYTLRSISPLRFSGTPSVTSEEKRFYNITSASYAIITTPITASLTPLLYSSLQVGYGIQVQTPTTLSGDFTDGTITGSITIGGNKRSINLPLTSILNKKLAFSDGYLISSSINNGIIKKLYLTSGSYATTIDNTPVDVTSSAVLQYATIVTSSTNIPISYVKLRVINLDTVSGEIYKLRVYSKVATNTADYKLVGDVYVKTEELLVSSSIRGYTPIGDMFLTQNYQDNWYAGTLTRNTGNRSFLYTVSGSSTYYDSSNITNALTVRLDNDILLSSIYASVPVDLSTNKFAGQVSESGYFVGTTNGVTLVSTSEYTLEFDAYYNRTSSSISLVGNTPKVDIYLCGVDGTTIIDNNPLGQKIGEIVVSGDTEWHQSKQVNFIPAIKDSGKVGIRFIIPNGFWNFSNISLKPASDERFAPDEVEILIPNTEYHNQLLQHKVEFFDINNNSTNVSAVTIPTFFTGSAIDLGTLPEVVSMYGWQYADTPIISGSTVQYWEDAIWVSPLNIWVAGGSRGIATSSNGLDWNETYNIMSGSLGTVNNIVWADNLSKLVAAYSTTDGTYTRTEIITSSNAIDWGHVYSIPKGPTESGLVYGMKYAPDIDTILLVQGTNVDSTLEFFTSTDAITWSSVGTQDFSYGFTNEFARRNNEWVAAGDTSGFFYTSSDATSWGTIATAANSNLSAAASTTGIFVAVSGTDAITWADDIGLFVLVSLGGFTTTAYNGTSVNEYTNPDSYTTYHTYTSTNGYTWTHQGTAIEPTDGWTWDTMASGLAGQVLLLQTATATGTDSAAIGTYNL